MIKLLGSQVHPCKNLAMEPEHVLIRNIQQLCFQVAEIISLSVLMNQERVLLQLSSALARQRPQDVQLLRFHVETITMCMKSCWLGGVHLGLHYF